MRGGEVRDPAKRRAAKLLKKYGITPAQWQAMYDRQKGLCDICAKPLTGRIYTDHDHKTGRVRGLLDFICNRLLLTSRVTPLMLRRAADYLESQFDGRRL